MDTENNLHAPLSKFSLNIFKVNGLLMRTGDRVTRALGQSSARWQVLGRAGYEPQGVAEMAWDMGHARQSVQRVADVLAEEGLVVYRDKPTDRRTKLVVLTARGRKILSAIYERNAESSQQIMAKLDVKKLTEVTESLAEIGRILEAHEQAEIAGEATHG